MKGALSDNMGQGLRSDPNLGTQVYHYCIYIYIYTHVQTPIRQRMVRVMFDESMVTQQK